MKSMLAVLALALPLLAQAQTQTIWRCGPEGRSYSDLPCAQGRTLEVPVGRPAADVQDAKDRAERERQQADRMVRERLQAEAAARGSGLASLSTPKAELRPVVLRAPAKKPKPKGTLYRLEDDGTLRAVARASRRASG